MIRMIHLIAAATATGLIALFWGATLVSELFLGTGAIVTVKTGVAYGLFLLIPAIAAAGGTGVALARGRNAGLARAKRRRMPFIAANGLLVLVPAALFLAAKAQAGAFDGPFYTVQAIELAAGAVNLTLLGLNTRDGRRMTRGRRRRPAVA